MLEFSGPINFLGPSPKAVEAVKQYAKFIKFYPDPNPVEFKEEVAKYVGHGVDEENIVLGNGSIELIYAITEILPRTLKRLFLCHLSASTRRRRYELAGRQCLSSYPKICF